LLRHCTRQLPQLLLEILPGCTGDLRLASEELRCEDELFFPLWEESFVLAALADATSDNASAADETDALQAAQLDWIICPHHPSHQRLLAWLGGGGTPSPLHIRQAACNWRDMVLAGLGVALLPPSLLTGDCAASACPVLPRRAVSVCVTPPTPCSDRHLPCCWKACANSLCEAQNPASETLAVQISSFIFSGQPDFLPTTARSLCSTPHFGRFRASKWSEAA
jgi:DNA-binding transcriptional LysR family regulator